jgi:hypothetical protein
MTVRAKPFTFTLRVVELPGEAHPRLVVAAPAAGALVERQVSERGIARAATIAFRHRKLTDGLMPPPYPADHGVIH